ncbi:hypothetical protein [Gemmobacter serpentinus]|uniref:hypothetical protein n=1 Tax=Gemmobacter serpentinus TaxID=2652247 RepID=UPI00124C5005|nr:hypothetical protein [Gemmobacter serpentinus]
MIRTLPFLALAVLLAACGSARIAGPATAPGRDYRPASISVRIEPPRALVTPESGGPARGDQTGSYLWTGDRWTRWEDL